jgi:hypothetical protein
MRRERQHAEGTLLSPISGGWTGVSTLLTGPRDEKRWYTRTGSNRRPIRCKRTALPLSYSCRGRRANCRSIPPRSSTEIPAHGTNPIWRPTGQAPIWLPSWGYSLDWSSRAAPPRLLSNQSYANSNELLPIPDSAQRSAGPGARPLAASRSRAPSAVCHQKTVRSSRFTVLLTRQAKA